MNNILPFFDYERCFKHYSKRILNIRMAVIRGERIKAKPALLVAIIDKMDEETSAYCENIFLLDDGLENRYLEVMRKYTQDSQFDKPTDINNPYWHLQSDGFWHLVCPENDNTPSKAWLKKKVWGAYLDTPLWIYLQNQEWRTKLRTFIVDHLLTTEA